MVQGWTPMDVIENMESYGNDKSNELKRLLTTTMNWAAATCLKGSSNKNSKQAFALTPLTNAPEEVRRRLKNESIARSERTKKRRCRSANQQCSPSITLMA